MLIHWKASVAVLSLCVLVGCGSKGSSSDQPASKAVAETEPPKRPIPADSPFAKIKEGMSKDEVFVTIGMPTSQGAYATGKAFIPFHYGGDNYRTIARYKGIGTIIFSQDSRFTSGMSVMEGGITYDPDEPGFERH